MTAKPIIFSGAAGSGKGTVLSELFKMSDNYCYSVSYTTRTKRPGEVHGVNYFFITREEFENRIQENDFAEYVEYCGNMYGTSRSYVKSLQMKGKSVVLEIETVGARNMMSAMPEAISIFIAPPSYSVLEKRLRGRGTETEDKIIKRLNRAKDEVNIAGLYDYIIVNPDGQQERVAEAINDICNGKQPDGEIVKGTPEQKQEFINQFFNAQEEQ
ncbi:MAG: guanylate kinase [Clostridia bacterium]|nr:guanylate kinase [Clostridia bacterium]